MSEAGALLVYRDRIAQTMSTLQEGLTGVRVIQAFAREEDETRRFLRSNVAQLNAKQNPQNWSYWQQRTGKEIASQLFKEEDFLHALEIYMGLFSLDSGAAWQLPLQYQIGLVYEHLDQPEKAAESYAAILAREKELTTNAGPALKMVLEMAQWRKDFLSWQIKAEKARQEFSAASQQENPKSEIRNPKEIRRPKSETD